MTAIDCLSRRRRLAHQKSHEAGTHERNSKVASTRRVLVLMVNVVATFLTLFTGLRENPVVLFVSGKYDYARSRFIDGDINYNIVRDDLVRLEHQLNLTEVGNSYKLIAGPDRAPRTVGENRNVCMRVNSVNVSVMRTNFDDFWGSGTRRLSRYFYSISAPHCEVINFKPKWVASCQNATLNANAADCFKDMLANFEALSANRLVQMGSTNEYGAVGAPYLRCRGRPEQTFEFITDYMLHQSYWAGGAFHVELQSSKCLAKPIIRSSDWEYGLFEVQPADEAASFLVAVDNSGWFASLVSYLYGFVSLILIAQGIIAAIVHSAIVLYIPKKLRFLNELKYFKRFFPFMPAATMFVEDENTVIHFKGTVLMASNLWINHWLYIFLSIMDAVVSVRTTYVLFGKGTWYLSKKATFENFIYTCTALSRITWFTCLVHTLIRISTKVLLRGIKTLRVIRPSIQHRLDWYVDAISLFLGYKIYSVLLFVLLYLFLATTGSVTLMVKGDPYKVGMYGGQLSYANFWQSELVCDYFVIVTLLTAGGWAVGSIMLFTKYRFVTNNRAIRLLQQRYLFVGWDIFVALDALGVDPYNPKLVVNDDTAMAHCSLGSLLQQMYQSGPSGLVSFAGDYLFEGGGFSREPLVLRFPTKKAIAMGLLETKPVATGRSTEVATKVRYVAPQSSVGDNSSSYHPSAGMTGTRHDDDGKVSKSPNDDMAPIPEFKSLFERRLRVFSEGTYGRLLLVDDHETGKYSKSETGHMEYSLRDALSYMGLHDIKFVLGRKKKLRVY